jgi:hypothetical protein
MRHGFHRGFVGRAGDATVVARPNSINGEPLRVLDDAQRAGDPPHGVGVRDVEALGMTDSHPSPSVTVVVNPLLNGRVSGS